MTSRQVVPIGDLGHRLPEHGRIRIGIKTNDARRMRAIDTFRLTTPDRTALELAAQLYGGTVRPWEDGPRRGEWDLITEVAELPIVLPSDPLGGTPIYELWSAGGCLRRCDGIMTQLPVGTPDGVDWIEEACHCDRDQNFVCKPKVRLNVILRQLPFAGTWRYETGSWNAARQMPGMVDAIQSMQSRGLTVGKLMLRNQETSWLDDKGKKKTKKSKIVQLGMDQSIDALAAGLASVTSLAPGAQQALTAGEDGSTFPSATGDDMPSSTVDGLVSSVSAPVPGREDPDDEIIDAEIVDDFDTDVVAPPPADTLDVQVICRVRDLVRWHAEQTGEQLEEDNVRHDLVHQYTGKRTMSHMEMSRDEMVTLIERCRKVMDGEMRFGVKDGVAKIGRLG